MFIDDKSLIKIAVYYKTSKEKRGIRVEPNLDKIPEDKRADWKCVNCEMRPVTWKMSNDLMRESRVKNSMTMLDEIDWISYKEKKLMLTVAKWDVLTEDGKPIPVTPEVIMKMHPLVAETLLSQYDKEAYLEEEKAE